MGLKGGYTIIDLSDAGSFTAGSSKTVTGIFNKIKNNYDKPCVLTGATVGTEVLKDQWMNAQLIAGGAAFAIYAAGYAITITNADAVIFVAYTPLTAPTVPTTNGTYTFKGTKNSSGFTYSWVQDT